MYLQLDLTEEVYFSSFTEKNPIVKLLLLLLLAATSVADAAAVARSNIRDIVFLCNGLSKKL